MSVADEILRLQQAKSDLATSIANKGVTVPSVTTIDGYAALVDQIQTGGSSYPFCTEIDYIETSGTQWINTGYYPNTNSKVRVVWMPTLINTGGYFGSRSADSSTTSLSRYTCTTFSSGSQFAFAMTYNVWPSNRFTLTVNSKYDCTAENGKYSCNGTQYTSSTVSNFSTGQPFLLSRYYTGATSSGYLNASMRIYAFQVWENDTLIKDMIPIRIEQIGYMYDKINGGVFSNAGTGSFTLGLDVT